ncbi:MAG: phosphate acyltransferase PlsX [Anaerolineae bacterium]|nr:phosphate acyltransferase PlsX [Anaerolineae bacterium]
MRIALDAMGSDEHPHPEVQAALDFTRQYKEKILLVGDAALLQPLLDESGTGDLPIGIVHADETFSMTDKISGRVLRSVKNSMGVAIDLVKNGQADVVVTAGNTGGAMGMGLARLGRIRGIKRPALSALFPVANGHCVVADIGANAECKPEYLLQFAIMGAVYAQKLIGVENPRVGLLSNGEEPGKGNQLTKESYKLLEQSDLNFIGNVEGKELFGGEADVVVTDGFTGNILLKTSEAVAKLLVDRLRSELTANPLRQAGALLAKPAFQAIKKQLDPTEVGAVPLLGLDGLVLVAHGRSNAKAMFNALKLAHQAVSVDMMESLRSAIEARINQ